MKNDFYETLPKYFKDFFDKYDYKPTNVFDANNFLKSCFKLDDLSYIYVKLNNPVEFEGKTMKFVKIAPNNPFIACLPEVWQSMKLPQRLKAVTMAFNYYFNQRINDRNKKPELHFITEFNLSVGVLGLSYVPKKYIYIPLEKINSADSGIKIFSTIVHELAHFEQENQKQKLCQWLEKNQYDFSQLSSYEKHLLFKRTGHILSSISSLYENRCDELFNKMLQTSSLTQNKIDLWLELEQNKDVSWRILKELTYSLNSIEIEAQRKETEEYNTLVKQLGGQSKNLYPTKELSELELSLIQKSGFDIDEEHAQHLANVGYFANLVETTDEVCFEILSYLLDVYQAKKVDKPFIQNYDEIEKQYFDNQRKELLKQRTIKSQQEEESDSKEF